MQTSWEKTIGMYAQNHVHWKITFGKTVKPFNSKKRWFLLKTTSNLAKFYISTIIRNKSTMYFASARTKNTTITQNQWKNAENDKI